MNIKKTAIAAAVTAAVGLPSSASALILTGSWNGVFTLLNPSGIPLANTDSPAGLPWYTNRTDVSGSLSFNTSTGAGGGSVVAFSFQGGGTAGADGITFQAIGDGAGGPGNLVLGNMGFNWSGNNGIPVSIILDATGFYGAGGDGYSTSETITGGAIPASSGYVFGAMTTYTLPIGPAPMATTTWNTTTVGGAACTLGCNPSGTLPLTDDAFGGSPMPAGPFTGWNANFDITSIHIDSVDGGVIPVPAAVWLFGSGLVGLVGVARRRKKAV